MNSMITFSNKTGFANLKSLTRSHFRTILAIFTALMILWGCEEEASVVGAGLLPDDDFALFYNTDTITINAYTMFVDSIRSNDSLYIIGTRYSPYFGTTSVEVVSQLNLLLPWDGSNFTIDSVSLILSIRYYEGDTVNNDQYLELYEISEYLERDSVYYSNKPVQVKSFLGSFLLDGLKADTLLEIPISNSIGEYLMRDTTKLLISSTQPDFRDFFRGLYMKLTDNPNPAMFSLRSGTASSGIQVYWHNDIVQKGTYSFVLGDRSAKYKRIEYDFSTADPDKSIRHINDFVKDTLVYMQKFNGVYTRLEFPGLEQLRPLLPLSVNKARLILPAQLDNEFFTDATVPLYLYLRYVNQNGDRVYIPDVRMGQQYFGGIYRNDRDHYYFNLAAFVQEYLEGRIPEPVVEVYMLPGNDADLILKANNAVLSPRFELSMTKF
jgi:hypothetical protein